MQIDREALALAISSAYPHRYDGPNAYISAAITAYLTALASQEGAQAGEVVTEPAIFSEAVVHARQDAKRSLRTFSETIRMRTEQREHERLKEAARKTGELRTTSPAPDEAARVALRAERADLAGHMRVLRHHCFWLPDINYREDIREEAQTLVDKTLERVCNRILRENKRQDWEAKRARKGGGA